MKNSPKTIIGLVGIFLLSTSLVVDPTIQRTRNAELDICDQVIKYSTNSITAPDGYEIPAPADITVNPVTRIITVESIRENGDKVDFETAIESIECTFSEKLKSGKAEYKGYVPQPDGQRNPARLVFEAEDGVVSLTAYAGDQKGISCKFTKWEIIDTKAAGNNN